MFRQTTNQNQNPFRAVTSPNGISDLLIHTFIWKVCDSRPAVDCEQSLFFFSFSESNARARERRSRETRETRAAAREEKRETARLARANELSVGLTTQNTIGWFVKRWQQTVDYRNYWQVDDGWSTAGKFVTLPEKKKTLDTEQREA